MSNMSDMSDTARAEEIHLEVDKQNPIHIKCRLAYDKVGTIHLTQNDVANCMVWKKEWFESKTSDGKTCITWKRIDVGNHQIHQVTTYDEPSYVDIDQESWTFWKTMKCAYCEDGYCGIVINQDENMYTIVDASGQALYTNAFATHVISYQ